MVRRTGGKAFTFLTAIIAAFALMLWASPVGAADSAQSAHLETAAAINVPEAGAEDVTAIIVDGTLPNSYQYPGSTQDNSNSLRGYFQSFVAPPTSVKYPRQAGVLTGIGHTPYDKSEAKGADGLLQEIRNAQAAKPDGRIVIGCLSQGAGSCSKTIEFLEKNGEDTSKMTFILMGNPRNTDGGLLTRLSTFGWSIPLIGATLGKPTASEYTNVVQVTRQYDGATDLPDYLLPIPLLNAALGGWAGGVHNYRDVDLNDPTAIITKNASGTVTHVFIPAPVGTLPLLMPLLSMGVPKDFVVAIEPLFKELVEMGYNREAVHPDQAVRIGVPGFDHWLKSAIRVAVATVQTLHNLGALTHEAVANHFNPQPEPNPVTDEEQVQESGRSADMQLRMSVPEPQEPAEEPQSAKPFVSLQDEPPVTESPTVQKAAENEPSITPETVVDEVETQPEDTVPNESEPSENDEEKQEPDEKPVDNRQNDDDESEDEQDKSSDNDKPTDNDQEKPKSTDNNKSDDKGESKSPSDSPDSNESE